MSENKELKEKISYERKSAWHQYSEEAFLYAEKYMDFLGAVKTERECVSEVIELAKKQGYCDLKKRIEDGKKVAAGEKFYYNHLNKCVVMFVIGCRGLECGMNITAAHIDAPRLDLKAVPVYEDGDIAFLKTHYYGGIKKYQWTAIPLALHGVVFTKEGREIKLSLGESEHDPVFMISELLIHLASEQMSKKASEAVTGEQLNVIAGNMPVDDDEIADKVKFSVLKLLYEEYGITEEDFISAEIEIVPAGRPRHAGFDRSMIAGYGHDDRVCSYAAFTSLFDTELPQRTCACILTDKEEIGSVGSTGLESAFFENAVSELYALMHENYSELGVKRTMANSFVLSMDVGAAFDPTFSEAFEKRNSAILGCGVILEKFGGSRGKSGSNDAHSEYMYKLRKLFNDKQVVYQTGELGRVDLGGGGTVAYLLAKYGASTVDLGVGVLSMHAPWELISKADLYSAYCAAREFYKVAE